MSKHTPVPWRIRHSRLVVGNSSKLDTPICTFLAVSSGGAVLDSEARANTEFAVRACNSHEELLTALKGMVALHAPVHTVRESVEALHKARAAIARAEGGRK